MSKEKTYDLYGELKNAYIGTINTTSKKKAIGQANDLGYTIKKAIPRLDDDSTVTIKQKNCTAYPYRFGTTYMKIDGCSLFGPGLNFYQEPESKKASIMICPHSLEEAEHLFALARDLVNYHREKEGKKLVK